jgi:hypothetical protein
MVMMLWMVCSASQKAAAAEVGLRQLHSLLLSTQQWHPGLLQQQQQQQEGC